MVLGVQSGRELRSGLVRSTLAALPVSVGLATALAGVAVAVTKVLPELGVLLLLSILASLVLCLVALWPVQVDISRAWLALKAWRHLEPYVYVTMLGADTGVTAEEFEAFVHRVLAAGAGEGTYLHVCAASPDQALFFERLGFHALGGTLALVGRVPDGPDPA